MGAFAALSAEEREQSLYITAVPWDFSSQDLRSLFAERFPSVLSARVLTNPSTGASKG